LTGPLDSWPSASNSPSGSINYWTIGTGSSQRVWSLETSLTTNVTGAQPPIFTQHDFKRTFSVTYATPVPVIGGDRFIEFATLDQPSQASTGVGLFRQRTLVHSNGVTIQASYYLQNSAADIQFLSPPLLRLSKPASPA